MSCLGAESKSQNLGGKDVDGSRSRSTSAGSSTDASRTSEVRNAEAATSPPGLAGPPGLIDCVADMKSPILLAGCIKAPPGLEDATPAGNALTLKCSLELAGLAAVARDRVLQLPVASSWPPPPPLQAPVIAAQLSAPWSYPPPVQAPAAESRADHAMPPPFMASVPPFMPLLPPPPLQAPVLGLQIQDCQQLPPPPRSSASVTFQESQPSKKHLQPPPTRAPTLPEELQAPKIPPPPSQMPTLQHTEEVGTAALPSLGSADHSSGTCRPCAFLYAKGCSNGENCSYCHSCPAGEKKRRMKSKREALRDVPCN